MEFTISQYIEVLHKSMREFAADKRNYDTIALNCFLRLRTIDKLVTYIRKNGGENELRKVEWFIHERYI